MNFKNRLNSRRIGHQIEEYACNYLKNQGLHLLEKNFYSKCGEIDLIMKDKKSIVFIEVRYRENFNYGTSTETITFNKQQKIIKTAYFYLYKENLYEKVCSRFDVIALSGTLNQLAVNWIKDAFQVPFD